MRLLRLIVRGFGWLLTPLVAWAASFLGAWLGAIAGAAIRDSTLAVLLAALAGIGGALVGTLLWLRLLRRSRQLREALAVTEEGVPEAVAEDQTEGPERP